MLDQWQVSRWGSLGSGGIPENRRNLVGIQESWRDFQEISLVQGSPDPRGSEESKAFWGIPEGWWDFLGSEGSRVPLGLRVQRIPAESQRDPRVKERSHRFGGISWFGKIRLCSSFRIEIPEFLGGPFFVRLYESGWKGLQGVATFLALNR